MAKQKDCKDRVVERHKVPASKGQKIKKVCKSCGCKWTYYPDKKGESKCPKCRST